MFKCPYCGEPMIEAVPSTKHYERLGVIDFLSFVYSHSDEYSDGDGWSMADLIYLADEYCGGLKND